MNSEKCKGCEWYGKPYWSINNPCDNCPRDNIQVTTRWIDPTIEQLQQENEELNKRVIIMEKYLELIYDLGFDYDGCNTVSSLKGVIDAMCDWASWGRVCNITKPIFESEGKAYNILHEEIDNEPTQSN